MIMTRILLGRAGARREGLVLELFHVRPPRSRISVPVSCPGLSSPNLRRGRGRAAAHPGVSTSGDTRRQRWPTVSTAVPVIQVTLL
jgi:hypothetical protein